VAGRTLLARHLDRLSAAGVDRLVVVTGHAPELIAAELAAARSPHNDKLAVETLFNERYLHGSLVSLWCARDELCQAGGLWMDADVLYPTELLSRLVRSPAPNALLIDGTSSEQGEEMMVAVRDDRVCRIARRVGGPWDLVGESVGFFKVDAAGAAAMRRVLEREVDGGRLDQEHEDALNVALDEVVFGYQRVDGLSWTEIDFPEDVERAQVIAAHIDG
jgi:choline kinase